MLNFPQSIRPNKIWELKLVISNISPNERVQILISVEQLSVDSES